MDKLEELLKLNNVSNESNETTIEDLVEALDILTSIVLGEEE